nr:hypothetical protein [Tanacetum cinerariifolium]
MKALLGAQDTWEFVTTEYEESADAEIDAMNANQLKALKEKRMKAKTALYLLFQSVYESGFEKIVGASTAKQAWDTLEKAYKGTDRVKQVRLQTLRGKLEAMKMKEAKGALDYITRVQTVVNQLKQAKDLDELTIEELACSLEAHEQRKNRKKQESLDEALQTKATIKEEKALYAQQNNYSRGNNTRGRNTNQGHDRGRDDSHQRGHYAKDCRSAKRTEEKTNLVTEPDVEEGGVLLMAHEEPVSKVDMIWYLDSGACHHMSRQRNLFTELTKVIQGYVSFGDASKIEVKGRRNIRFLYAGKERAIEDVYYVPAMKSNILSLGQLMKKGFLVLMKNGKLLLKNREGSFRALVNMCKNHTFKLDLNSVGEKCLRSDLTDKESVWHLRFGHLHFNGLKELVKKNMKSQAFETFKKFKAMVEKTTCKYIKALRSDRDGEYLSISFTKFCKEQGIKRFLTTPYSPQQNGIAKRKNRTIMNMVRSMLKTGGKDRPPMLAPGNYIQWKSRIKRYIDTKPNHELIHYCLKNPPYKFTWADKVVPVSEGSLETTTERLKHGESINVQDLETNLYWELEKFTSWDGESLESYYSRFFKMMNELVRNQCDVTNHQVNVSSYFNYNQNGKGKAIVNSPLPIYDQEPSMVAEDDEMSKDKEIDKLMALISLSFKKIYKPTNNNLRTSLNTSRANQDNSPRINRSIGYENQRIGNVAGARETVECQKQKRAKDASYHKKKMLLCNQEEARVQLNAEQADWRDDTDDESEDHELEAHYMYMAQIQEVSLDTADSGPIFDTEPMQKVRNKREKEKIGTKPDNNGKRGKARKSQEQSQWIEREKPKKT